MRESEQPKGTKIKKKGKNSQIYPIKYSFKSLFLPIKCAILLDLVDHSTRHYTDYSTLMRRPQSLMPPIIPWPSHQELLRALYRQLLRNLTRLRSLIPDIDARENASGELIKAKRNPQLYGELLRTELKYRIDEEFHKVHPRINERSFYSNLIMGERLNSMLESVINGKDVKTVQQGWSGIIKIVVDHRNIEQERNRWKMAYLRNKSEIDQRRDKDTDSLTARRRSSSRNRTTVAQTNFANMSLKEQRKAMRKAMTKASENSAFVVRNYLKKLQLEGRIPNPYKLPYVPVSLSRLLIDMPRDDVLIPGSTKSVVLDAAYDSEYIESIIKPEVEFKINHLHHMGQIERNIKDGPYKVKIRNTNAGVMTANFLRLPFNRESQMREIALDIKRLMRAVRKQFVWNLQPSKGMSVPEKRHGQGYGVRDSGGFSPAEIMFPREYYEKLVSDEAFWETLMEIEQLRSIHGDSILEDLDIIERLHRRANASLAEWNQPLVEATKAVNDEVQSYYTKYKIDLNSPIWKDQEHFQKLMNEKFDHTVARYADLLGKLQQDRVFMHSELYRASVVGREHHISGQQKSKLEEIPENPRRGQGKHLGDYLEDHGFKAYMLGYNYRQRFDF